MSSIFQRIMQIQIEIQEDMLRKRNVVGVGLGYKETRGVITDEPAVVIMVEAKRPVEELSDDDVVPREVGGVRTDVYEVGRLAALKAPTDRFRPTIPAGVSIGHQLVTAGTLGVIVRDRTTGERLILSNNHVLANSNNAQPGDAILQPAPLDGGQHPADLVARLERFIPLTFLEQPSKPKPTPPPSEPSPDQAQGCLAVLMSLSTLMRRTGMAQQRVQTASASSVGAPALQAATVAATPGALPANIADCALARPIDTAMFSDQILGIGVVRASKNAELGMRVRKSGRTTGTTESVVTLLNATVDVAYGSGTESKTARFAGQVICEPMSEGGDSGALVVDTENFAVGLLFAGSPLATIFTPVETVFNALNVMLG